MYDCGVRISKGSALAAAPVMAGGAQQRVDAAANGAAIAGGGTVGGAPACVACHGAHGEGMAAAGFPRLAGLPAAYLSAQLDNFAAGRRQHPVMAPIAAQLTVPERAAVAAYYAALAGPLPGAAADTETKHTDTGAWLAQRSAAAAKEIKALIAESVERVDVGCKLVNEAGATMGEVVTSIRRVTEIMSEIALAGQEQSSGIAQVNQAVAQMDHVTQQNAALVEEAAAAADAMQAQAQQLSAIVSAFKVAQANDRLPGSARLALTA